MVCEVMIIPSPDIVNHRIYIYIYSSLVTLYLDTLGHQHVSKAAVLTVNTFIDN